MNNSFVANENILLEDEAPQIDMGQLRAKETELMAIIDAAMRIANNPDWLTLKEKVFDGVVVSIKKRRDIEVERKPLNGPMIHSLNGQLEWAKKFSDIVTIASIYKQELLNVRKVINAKGKESRNGTGSADWDGNTSPNDTASPSLTA